MWYTIRNDLQRREARCESSWLFVSWMAKEMVYGDTPAWHVSPYYSREWSNYVYIYIYRWVITGGISGPNPEALA